MPADTTATRSRRTSSKTIDTVDLTHEVEETLTEASDTLKQITRDFVSVYSDTMTAAMASAGDRSHIARDLTQAYIDAWSQQAQAMTKLGRDMLTCHTPTDFGRVQKQAFETVSRGFETITKLQMDFISSWTKSAEPVLAQAAKSPGRLFGAMAD